VQTCRRELLDRTLIWNQRHLLRALREFEQFYNGHQPHQGIAKTARRYVQAAQQAGVARDGGPGQVTDEVIGAAVRPAGHGSAWQQLQAHREQITAWVGRA
jgi:hypothetical protein